MRIRLNVVLNGQFFDGGSAVEVPECFVRCFEAEETCDSPYLSHITGERLVGDIAVASPLKLREDAADILSATITKLILSEMQKYDTHNGYIKEKR